MSKKSLKRLEKKIKAKLEPIAPAWLAKSVRGFISFYKGHPNLTAFQFPSDDKKTIKKAIAETYDYHGDFLDLFVNSEADFPVHKWHNCLPIYDKYFTPYRNTPVRFLEIGVWKGGSLRMWRDFFGDKAIIYGIDIEPDCAKFDGIHGQVRIGSQDDPNFLLSVIKEMGGVDIVLDDGSHHMQNVKASLKALLPHLTDKGIYMIEDTHTAYWWKFGGGYHSKNNIYNFVRDIIDDMHGEFHKHAPKVPGTSDHCHSIHIYNNVVAIEKGKQNKSYHSIIG